jgi:hypothetical protein
MIARRPAPRKPRRLATLAGAGVPRLLAGPAPHGEPEESAEEIELPEEEPRTRTTAKPAEQKGKTRDDRDS